jgi:hypothetical protein
MVPPFHTTDAALVDAERALALKTAERRARVSEATRRPRSAGGPVLASIGRAAGLLRGRLHRAGIGGTIKRAGLAGVLRRPA